MALNINGTTGISGVDGSVSAPALTGTDSNTGITFPAADTIKFATGGVERMSITNSGITGISGGKILKVKQAIKTNTFTSSTNGTDIPDLSVIMDAPASSGSKYLILANVPVMGSNYGGGLRLHGTTNGVLLQPTSYGSRTPVSGSEAYESRNDVNKMDALCFLDSPGSASAQTYKVQVSVGSNGPTIKINRLNVDTDSASYSRGCATLTVMEVAA